MTPQQIREITCFVQDRIMDASLSARERDTFRLIEQRLVEANLAESELEAIAQAGRIQTA